MPPDTSRALPEPPHRLRGRILLHGFLVLVGLAMVAPFLLMLLTSFKSLGQILREPLSFWPDPWVWTNFADAWNSMPFARAYWNSIYICVLVVAITLVTTALAGYGFARINFRGSKVLFIFFLATQMVPTQVTIVPLYLLLSRIGWVDSHLALIVPISLCNPFAVFLMRQFVRSLPIELEEAALLDGANRLQIFFRVILPNLGPGLGALGVVVALNTLNNFFYPLILLNSEELFTVPLLLSRFQDQYGGMNYALVMAASAISVIPMLIAFVIGQRRIISSMAMSGLGGK
ncbi:carbohydrate ABC transporter permease [Phytoactinopolyspora limicola]|uniref:carbohydrate ABC transporter permease n=1 Tax=Phytoactinopolyspora limicola TaxID=2715536 RepID=UPI00140A562A|nr:carbohydrate ABC transporter permease [Phytoactinopolyspora limicola]